MALGELLEKLPFVTVSVMMICVLVQVYVFLATVPIGEYAISPARVVYQFQFYRVITAPFFHGGLMHLGMNMMSLYSMGTSLETQFGSMLFAFSTAWSLLLTNGIYISFSAAFYALTGSPGWMMSSAVGFSGVLFHYALLESYHSPVPTRSVFGIFSVPAKIYPWILLVVLQVMLPNISLLGHLSGILVGLLQVYGFLRPVMPTVGYMAELTDWPPLHRVTRLPSFRLGTGADLVLEGDMTARDVLRHVITALRIVSSFIIGILLTILTIVGCGSTAQRMSASLQSLLQQTPSQQPPPTAAAAGTGLPMAHAALAPTPIAPAVPMLGTGSGGAGSGAGSAFGTNHAQAAAGGAAPLSASALPRSSMAADSATNKSSLPRGVPVQLSQQQQLPQQQQQQQQQQGSAAASAGNLELARLHHERQQRLRQQEQSRLLR